MSTTGFLRHFLAECCRGRASRSRAEQESYPAESLGHQVAALRADLYEAMAEGLDLKEERRRVLRLATLYPITLSTAQRYDKEYGEMAGLAIELKLQGGRAP